MMKVKIEIWRIKIMMVEELLMQEREEWIEEGKAIGRLETKAADIGSGRSGSLKI